MKYRMILGLLIAAILSACASVPQGDPSIGVLDLSAERLVSDRNRLDPVSSPMIAEVAYVENLRTGDVVYRYRADERSGIASKVLELTPGEYRIASFCSDRNFPTRFIGFIDMELLQGKYWWGNFAQNNGKTGSVSIQVFDLNVFGGELITPVNMSAITGKSCSVLYGQKASNTQPSAAADEAAFRDKFGKKSTLYN